MILLDAIAQHLAQLTAIRLPLRQSHAIAGGCINRAMKISDGNQSWFVKINQAGLLPMFEAEADALKEMESGGIRVPKPVCHGTADDLCYLVQEYLELNGRMDSVALGGQLAGMHQCTAQQFGWHRNNTIGATPQINTVNADWLAFWRQHRLGFQLQLAANKGFDGAIQELGTELLQALPMFFAGYRPQASLLHGDLWGGNAAALADGTPVIFDPALYYGDRETDIAMTSLFGGFDERFYAAYNDVWPLDAGYKHRKTLYNLYHVLNHLNLFGGGYQQQALTMMRQLLALI